MSRRDWMRHTALLLALGAQTPLLNPTALAQTSRPNILLLMADQHRGDTLGIAGHPAAYTPNLDRIAREGAYFSHAYSTTPTCTPARAALLTGLQPWNHGLLGYSKVGLRYPVEMPQALRDAGYYTTGIGKMHWHPQRNLHGFHQTILDESGREATPEFRSDYRAWFKSAAPNLDPDATGIGFNSYRAGVYALPEELHPTRWTAGVAINFLESYNQPGPFFLKVSFARPHSPYDPPKRWMDHYNGAHIPAPAIGEWAAINATRDTPEDTLWCGDLGAETVRHSRQGYLATVSFVDEQIGRILAALEARGMLENTLILYTSDHGDMTGDHHLWRKGYPYEASARIPMLLRWPNALLDAPRGQIRTEPVEIRDILPTFLDAAGATVPQSLDGRSMLDLFRSGAPAWRQWIDLEHDVCYDKRNHWSAVTDGNWKYIYHAQDGAEQLFHLTRDPGELHNLAGKTRHQKTLKQWRARLIAHLEPRGEHWVKNGKLVPRPNAILHSPAYETAMKET
ncbi:MAG: arylsulfatase [Candidatus Hydrogenedentes bacterium]|nr:arylsulfatase [Candidatus Hydrogenedentota bacterium]